MNVIIDGSCMNISNYKVGGWGFILTDDNYNIIHKENGKLRKGIQTCTRAELESLYQSLLYIQNNYLNTKEHFVIYTDYLEIKKALEGLSLRKKNRDIWEDIEYICKSLEGRLSVNHIYSHTDNTDIISVLNNQADRLARIASSNLLIPPVNIIKQI